MKGRARVAELKNSKRGTRGTGEAEQEHMRGTTGAENMYSRGTMVNNRCTTEVQQRPYTKMRIHNTIFSLKFQLMPALALPIS